MNRTRQQALFAHRRLSIIRAFYQYIIQFHLSSIQHSKQARKDAKVNNTELHFAFRILQLQQETLYLYALKRVRVLAILPCTCCHYDIVQKVILLRGILFSNTTFLWNQILLRNVKWIHYVAYYNNNFYDNL